MADILKGVSDKLPFRAPIEGMVKPVLQVVVDNSTLVLYIIMFIIFYMIWTAPKGAVSSYLGYPKSGAVFKPTRQRPVQSNVIHPTQKKSGLVMPDSVLQSLATGYGGAIIAYPDSSAHSSDPSGTLYM